MGGWICVLGSTNEIGNNKFLSGSDGFWASAKRNRVLPGSGTVVSEVWKCLNLYERNRITMKAACV